MIDEKKLDPDLAEFIKALARADAARDFNAHQSNRAKIARGTMPVRGEGEKGSHAPL